MHSHYSNFLWLDEFALQVIRMYCRVTESLNDRCETFYSKGDPFCGARVLIFTPVRLCRDV